MCDEEGWVGKPCARRDKMAPAAPSLAGAMMGLGEGVAGFRPLLLSVFPEVSVSFIWA